MAPGAILGALAGPADEARRMHYLFTASPLFEKCTFRDTNVRIINDERPLDALFPDAQQQTTGPSITARPVQSTRHCTLVWLHLMRNEALFRSR